MMRGKKPKPAAVQIAEGDPAKRGVHKLDAMLAAEPKCESGLPECSPRLKGDAAKAYAFYREQLTQSDLATMPDVYALERACVALATIWRADRALLREGPIHRVPVMTGRGNARRRVGFRQAKNKWLAVRVEAEKQFHSFASQFGLTGPSSRVRLGVDHSLADADRELWRLLSTPRPPGEDAPEISDAPPEAKPS